ncbi:MAG: hypothetical protein V1799_04110 [bacterium]
MKILKYTLIILLGLALQVGIISAEVKEVKSSPVTRIGKPAGDGEYQLRVKFRIPEIPDNAHIDNVFLILDQQFEMPVKKDTSRMLVRDTLEVPKGLLNKSHTPVLLSVLGFDEKSVPQSGSWLDIHSSKNAILHTAMLHPVDVVQQERAKGKRKDEAVIFSVTQFVRDQSRKKSQNVEFIIVGEKEGRDVLNQSKVEVDVSKLSGRLVIYYTEKSTSLPEKKSK